ncbi:uncharacterized protein BDZ83DRAFT_374060 [Colletotrichum acutatum]|uniref:Uncharacterized protein n=1 Tax=Glomerella acutata TaxID=27357 RepID=A0AAD8XNG1_GLOAC|nr:uncharacterized protein BDZ83DRAFT_374060 [Colletotrichum acutatum]KAK1730536.1 hypothetical protein BDZ83DRAFT_374060 [Colletotrichum acutatum]
MGGRYCVPAHHLRFCPTGLMSEGHDAMKRYGVWATQHPVRWMQLPPSPRHPQYRLFFDDITRRYQQHCALQRMWRWGVISAKGLAGGGSRWLVVGCRKRTLT